MLTHRSIPPLARPRPLVPFAKPDQFCGLTGHAGLVASEFSYRKDEEIYGEDELAEYVYQVIRGAVRTYKLLSDGRRQIGAFLLPGDVFGLESATAIASPQKPSIDTTVRLVKRSSPRAGRRRRRPGRAQALGHHSWRAASRGKSHAAARTQERDGARRDLPAGDGSPPRSCRHDGVADVPSRHRRLSRTDAGNGVADAVAPWRGRSDSRVLGRSCCAIASACETWTPENGNAALPAPI